MKKISLDTVLLITGFLFSFLVVITLPRMYFPPDLHIFWDWSEPWNANWRAVYLACSTCNYPILGMFFSAGLMGFFRASGLGFDEAVFRYRLLLALVDGLNVLLVFWILKRLQIRRAAFLAGLTGVLISSWAGGALWGQIDGFSQLMTLLSLAWIVVKNTSTRTWERYYYLYEIVGAALLAGLLLTKQLTNFSAACIGLLLLADLVFHSSTMKSFLLNAAVSLGAFGVVLLGWDVFLQSNPPYLFHLVYVWNVGNFNNDIISGNGFNIWVLLGRDIWSSARVPILPNLPFATPTLLGELLFVALAGILTLSLGLFVWRRFQNGETHLNSEILLNFILYLAMINLCFNVFLSGTHERYLYHFYPFILIAWVGLTSYSRLFSARMRLVLILCSTFYGLFVLQILNGVTFNILPFTAPHMLLSVIHLALFSGLCAVSFRYQALAPNIRWLFRNFKAGRQP